ncbi:MAG: response regulator [Myxococcota bacterium]
MTHGTVQVLLVEDNDVDVEAVRRAFRKYRIANPIRVARDGVEALEILRGTEERPPLERPYLILLDLNMPRMDGVEFLGHLRADEDLHDSIVLVLTTSNRDKDKVASYDKHVAGYIVKKDVGRGFMRLLDLLDCYWRIVEFPPPKEGGQS